jgi:hypothetical protein
VKRARLLCRAYAGNQHRLGRPARGAPPRRFSAGLPDVRGLRELRTIADKLTRVHVTLPLTEARRLQERLAELTAE